MASKESSQETAPPKRDYELYIMRHGIAVTRGAGSFADDAKRQLTPEGKMKVQEIVQGLLRLDFEVDWILTSPLVRAVETAEIVSDAPEGWSGSNPLRNPDISSGGACWWWVTNRT